MTGAGARLLASRLSSPLTDIAAIAARHDAVSYFESERDVTEDIRKRLKETPDAARALSRLAAQRGGPRDIAVLRDALMRAREIASLLPPEGASLPADLRRATEALENRKGEGFSALITMLREALSAELPMLARDGGFIAKGYDAGLDSVRLLRDESRRVIAGLESKYRDLAGLKNLKIKHNNVLG